MNTNGDLLSQTIYWLTDELSVCFFICLMIPARQLLFAPAESVWRNQEWERCTWPVQLLSFLFFLQSKSIVVPFFFWVRSNWPQLNVVAQVLAITHRFGRISTTTAKICWRCFVSLTFQSDRFALQKWDLKARQPARKKGAQKQQQKQLEVMLPPLPLSIWLPPLAGHRYQPIDQWFAPPESEVPVPACDLNLNSSFRKTLCTDTMAGRLVCLNLRFKF